MLRLLRTTVSNKNKIPILFKRLINTTVVSFGDNSHSALGLPISQTGINTDTYEPTSISSSNLPSNVSSVSAGHYHSLAVTSNGDLYTWGRNSESQLGRGPHAPRDRWNEPKKVEGLEGVGVRAAFGSGVISAAIGDDGSLWVWGKSKRGQLGLGKGIVEALVPTKVESLSDKKIAKAAFGWGHALALSEDGKLFGWGYSADGRLGKIGGAFEMSPLDLIASKSKSIGSTLEVAEQAVLEGIQKENDMPIVWEPSYVEELDGVEVADIACGLDHSLILCRNGTLLSCGSNVYGQLGRAKQDMGMFPVDISSHPTSIASGLGHCLAICQDNSSDTESGDTSIVSWGWNQCSQLGRPGPANVPSVIEGLEDENPISVSGGRVHSLALTSNGEVWVWGCGKNGRLGLGSSSDETEPFWLDQLEGRNVLQAVSGFDHNLLLVAE
ncbi:hypothetical protein ACFE04_029710 [Oxalis oulophora]